MALFGKKKEDKAEKQVKDKSAEVQSAPPTGTALPKGGDAHSYEVVLSPHITEKGTNMGPLGKYVFKVANNANKIEIRKAVEKLYKVRVNHVNITKAPVKYKQMGRQQGHKSGFKKATVTLKQGDKIDLAI